MISNKTLQIHIEVLQCVELYGELQILSVIHRIIQTPQTIPPSSLILLTEGGDALRRNSGIFLYSMLCTLNNDDKLVHMHLNFFVVASLELER